MTTIEEHMEKPVENQVVDVEIGGIYRRHLFKDDNQRKSNWFVVVDKYEDDGSERVTVYDLKDGSRKDRFLSDMGVNPYSENNYHSNACTEKHELSIPKELVVRKSKLEKIKSVIS
jgi:hypothetical protein